MDGMVHSKLGGPGFQLSWIIFQYQLWWRSMLDLPLYTQDNIKQGQAQPNDCFGNLINCWEVPEVNQHPFQEEFQIMLQATETGINSDHKKKKIFGFECCRRVLIAGAAASTTRAIIETPLELAKVMIGPQQSYNIH